MDRKEIFSHLTVSKQEFRELLASINYKCNADGRKFMAEHVKVNTPRPLPKNAKRLLELAAEIGGLKPGTIFRYPTMQGEQIARVCSLYDLPEDMENPFMVCFSGYITAPLYCMEVLRFYAKKTDLLLPFLAIGKGGNKGLFEHIYNRKTSSGYVIGSEAEAYINIMESMAPLAYAAKYKQTFNDMDTAGNLRELHRFAKEQCLKEVTFVLVTGQPWYDKRLLAEWMLMLCDEEFSDIKINLVLAHCPLWLNGATPDSSISEISLGYAAAGIGPILKDTINFDGSSFSETPERYNLAPNNMGFRSAPLWREARNLITLFGNMGWPDYEELLYDTPHKTAVEHIILADLFARRSFDAEMYDDGIKHDIIDYLIHVNRWKYEEEENESAFLAWLIDTPEEHFFN